VRTKELNKMLEGFLQALNDSTDTLKPALPFLVQHNEEFEKIPDVVRAPLFIDGSHFDLTWKSKRKIIVDGDLQITKKVRLEGMTFHVTGTIKILDDTYARDVYLFSKKSISIGDKAIFSGTAISQATIIVFGRAVVENRSMIIVIPSKTAAPSSPGKAGGGNPSPKKKLPLFSVTFTENSFSDATIITIGDTLGVKIDRNAVVKGVIRTQGALALDGKIWGTARASKVIDPIAAMSGRSYDPVAIVNGSFAPLDDIASYHFPFFMGKLSILSWVEE
jgi:cytoskeletal protein CcmA (bactofilin family)